MDQKILFFICFAWSCLSVASQHKERILEAQEFTHPDSQWLEIKEIEKIESYRPTLIITCSKNNHDPEFEPLVYFEQNQLGELFAIYNRQHQRLGHFPDLKLRTDETSTEWYDDTLKTVRILISYSKHIIKNPL
jgi:hypothetical protein